MAGAAIGKILAKGLTQGLAKNVGKQAVSARGAIKNAAKTKSLENVRQGSIIETQKAKERLTRTKAFKEALKKAKANKQKSFTFEGERFQTARY